MKGQRHHTACRIGCPSIIAGAGARLWGADAGSFMTGQMMVAIAVTWLSNMPKMIDEALKERTEQMQFAPAARG